MTVPTDVREVARRRLAAQHLLGDPAASPADVVRHLGAVQAQEFPSARWSLGRRSASDDTAVSAAYDRGDFLRTPVLRPTWHFVPPEDLRWMQRLTADRVRNQNRHGARRAGVDEDLVSRSVPVLEKALAGGRALTKAELRDALAAAGLDLSGHQVGHLALRAEIDDVVTSGPARGRLHTYMLVDERVTQHRRLDGDEALAELTRRYFRSHGPASDKDFAWWSSLPLSQVRRGLQSLGDELATFTIDDVAYWFDPTAAPGSSSGALMLSTFDEYVVAYRPTRKVAYDVQPNRSMNPNTFAQPLVVDGQVVGTWRRRSGGAAGAQVEVSAPRSVRDLVDAELARYGRFLGSPHVVAWTDTGPR